MVKRVVWLCSACSDKYVVQTWRPLGEQVRLRESEHPSIVAKVFSTRSVVAMKRVPAWRTQRPAA
jgi:hypothetical protein